MKIKILHLILIFIFLTIANLAQSDSTFDVLGSYLAGSLPYFSEMPRGGINKTAIGELKVLVVFVRFLDDHTNYPLSWPDYTQLPTWAQQFINPTVPGNGIYYPKSLSDFFDRCSGGNGAGSLGQFKMVGNIYYVTTKYNQSNYTSDDMVNTEILQTLDDPNGIYKINFKNYDNWRFKKNAQPYNHEYLPNVGDGIVDQIFFIWRKPSFDRPNASGYTPGYSSTFTTNDGVIVSPTVYDTPGHITIPGSANIIFKFTGQTTPDAVRVPAHEFCHYLFGGDQNSGHWDGHAGTYDDIGRIYTFGLMVTGNIGYMNAYERYRLGWLNPSIMNTNTSYFTLGDTYINNQALILPLIYDPTSGWLKEFYFVENYESQLVSQLCNPFLYTERFGDNIYNGILVYHIWYQNYDIPTGSNISMECSDGRWQWKLISGSSTPNDRSDDIMGKDYSLRYRGYNERSWITINAGGTIYNDYVCLQPRSDFPGAHYNKNTWLGKYNDFFKLGYNETFTRYSNPASIMSDGTPTNIGFKVLSYNSSTREYALSLQFDNTSILALNPSKPQNLQTTISSLHNPILTWEANLEPNLVYYNIYRSTNSGQSWQYLNQSNTPSYTDILETYCKTIVQYRVSAVNSSSSESVQSDPVAAKSDLMTQDLIVGTNETRNLSGNCNLNMGISVSAGGTLNILPGAVLNFTNNIGMVINGILHALGSGPEPQNCITFQRDGTSGNWGTILISGSYANGSTIQYANIQYGTEIDVFSANNVTIQNCNILYSSMHGLNFSVGIGCSSINNTIKNTNTAHGIFVQNGASVTCTGNYIKKIPANHTGVGIYFGGGGTGVAAQNDIYGFSWGIGALWGSCPTSNNVNYPAKNNRITNCSIGIEVYNNSYVTFGNPSYENHYSLNSIYDNTYYNVEIYGYAPTYSSWIYADYNWWGDPLITSKFHKGDASANIYYDNPISSDPWVGIPSPQIKQIPVNLGNRTAGVHDSKIILDGSNSIGTSNINDSLFIGINLWQNNKLKDAKNFFMSYLKQHPDDQAAYTFLYGCADSSSILEIISFFNPLPSKASNEQKLLLSYLYLKQGDIDLAKNVNNQVMKENQNTPLGIRAKLNNFYIALYDDNDLISASSLLNEVKDKKRLSTQMEITTAEDALTVYSSYLSANSLLPLHKQSSDKQMERPISYSLSQNYPNPFNPSTLITYQIPNPGNVTLKVYDILGKEVVALVNEYKNIGQYSVNFDASKLASGIYIYQLKSNDFISSKKMILIK